MVLCALSPGPQQADLCEYEANLVYREGEQAGFTKGEQIGFTKGEQAGFTKGEQIGFTKGEQHLLEAQVRKKLQRGKDAASIAGELETETGVIETIIARIRSS